MSNQLPTKFKYHLITLGILSAMHANAQLMNIADFHYRDYIDFGVNQGQFKANHEDVTVSGKHGNSVNLNRVPNFSATNNNGNIAALGRNYVVTAQHISQAMGAPNVAGGSSDYNRWGQTRYFFQDEFYKERNQSDSKIADSKKKYGADTAFIRTDKYIVEGALEVSDTGNISLNQLAKEHQNNDQQARENYQQQTTELGNYIHSFKQLFQAGSGTLQLLTRNGNTSQKLTEKMNNNKKGAGMWQSDKSTPVYWETSNSRLGLTNGVMYKTYAASEFFNTIETGDSGSALLGFDEKSQKWRVVAIASTGDGVRTANWTPVLQADFDNYKAQFEHQMSDFNPQHLQDNKDNIFTNAGTLTLNNELDLGAGGLVFQGGEYHIEGGKIKRIAGFDIAQDSSVTLNSTVEGDLHKIGQGSLTVKKATGGNLRFGSGTVNLNDAEAFKKIYITGNNAQLTLQSHFNVQDKVFFGNGGGILNLNGHDQTVNNFSVNNNAAQVINRSEQKATITFAPETEKTIVHAKLGTKETHNLNVNYKKNQNLAFDGGFDLNNLEVDQGTVTLQGHPTTHAYLEQATSEYYQTQKAIFEEVNKYDNLPDYMDLTRPSTLAQPDWDKREYHAQNIQLKNNAHLNIGKDAKVFANIQGNNATITLGGSSLAHFIDRVDGNNTFDDESGTKWICGGHCQGFKYQQQAESQAINTNYRSHLEAKNIQLNNSQLTAYNADIVGQHLTLQNNAHIALNDHSQLTLEALDLAKDHNITTDDNSSLNVKNLIVPNQAVKLAAHTYIQTKLTVKAGDHTALTTSGKTIHLEKDASFDMAIEDELKNLAVDTKKTITFEHLDDQRANKDEVNFSQLPAETYFTYQYDSDKNQMILTRVAKDPTSKDNLQDILNGNANNNVDSPISNPSENNPQPDSTTPSGPGDSAKPSQPTENKPASTLDNQLLDLLMASENQITSLKQQLDDIGRNENKDRPALLNLIRRTEQDFNTLGKQEWLLNKVNFLSATIGDEQSENLWLSSGYAGNKLKTQHLMLGTNFHYGRLTLGATIGQFKVKKDNQDADVTVLSGKLVKNLANNWAIHSHLTGLWANNKLDFYSESLKSNQHSRYKEYGLNVDVQAAYTYDLTPHLSLMPKFGLGYSFAQQNQVQTQDFRKAKQHYQLLNVLAGVALDYQVKQASFGALVNVAQPILLSGKEQKLGFKNNADYRVNAENPKTLVKFGLQGRYAFSNNVNINAESGISSLSSFYLNLGLGYRF